MIGGLLLRAKYIGFAEYIHRSKSTDGSVYWLKLKGKAICRALLENRTSSFGVRLSAAKPNLT